eukprot:TRINITY_DN19895_c0_g2_i2.p1 TRINITY_DN19895_c0_g2~~TRINITY_DN19895_c0_g2_i2.p1  ORF type:complete len:500 (-),score=107.58 TRINITY_DN19895_c0_g2_i2:208-1707(-)
MLRWRGGASAAASDTAAGTPAQIPGGDGGAGMPAVAQLAAAVRESWARTSLPPGQFQESAAGADAGATGHAVASASSAASSSCGGAPADAGAGANGVDAASEAATARATAALSPTETPALAPPDGEVKLDAAYFAAMAARLRPYAPVWEVLAVASLPPLAAAALAFIVDDAVSERPLEVHLRIDIDLRAAAFLAALLFWALLLPPCYRRWAAKWRCADSTDASPKGEAATAEAEALQGGAGDDAEGAAGAAEASPNGADRCAAAVADVRESADQEVQVELPEPSVRGLPEDLLRSLAEWRFRPGDFEFYRRQADEKAVLERLYSDMLGACPVLVHRFPPAPADRSSGSSSSQWSWASPLFSACGRLWSLRMGPISAAGPGAGGGSGNASGGAGHGAASAGASCGGAGAVGGRYFCLLPHGHTDRLRCSLLFARRPGEGFRERVVQNWPPDLAGHPWGPTVHSAELETYLQADNSILVMVQAVGLAEGASGGSKRQAELA